MLSNLWTSLVLLLFLLTFSSALQPFSTWQDERIQLEDVSIHFRYSNSGKPPILLIHGFPEHSPTWYQIGPILAEKYTVIAPDIRGMGDSSLSRSDNYTAPAGASDMIAILNFLNITKAYVVGFDKGVGLATSLAIQQPERIEQLVLMEYPLPGYGYSTETTSPDLYMNWHLGFFAVPDAAQFFIQGKEKEMLSWYFFHTSYSGTSSISNDLLETYTRSISKPGFLRSGLMYFAAAFQDKVYFTSKFNSTKLQMPVLALGGEAALAPASQLRAYFEPIASDLTVDIVPKAGHWIADENPVWVANRLLRFFGNSSSVPGVDLSSLEHMTTMFGGSGLGLLTPGIDGVNGTQY